jgi:hypothetical protein
MTRTTTAHGVRLLSRGIGLALHENTVQLVLFKSLEGLGLPWGIQVVKRIFEIFV